MNIKDYTIRNKLSIYDLLVSKNKNSEKIHKEQIKKKLLINLSDIDLIADNISEAKKVKYDVRRVSERNNGHTQGSDCIIKMNVVMEGRAVTDGLRTELVSERKKDPYLLDRFQKNILEEEQELSKRQKNEITPKSLAVISDLGTSHKYGFSQRPSKLVPISTLKPRQEQLFSGAISSTSKVEAQKAPEADDSSRVISFCDTDTNEHSDYNKNENFGEHRERKASKIRSVDEILSSLKSEDYMHSQMESDVRIDELIKKVLERTNDDEDDENKAADHKTLEEGFEKENYNKGDFEREAEGIVEELEMEQSLKSIDDSIINVASEDENFSRLGTENEVSESEQKTGNIDEKLDDLRMDLNLNIDATKEDLIGVYGKRFHIKLPRKDVRMTSVAAKERKTDLSHIHRSIHDICSTKEDFDQDVEGIRKQWIAQYIPDKFPMHKVELIQNRNIRDVERIEMVAEKIMAEKERIEKWEKIANKFIEDNKQMEIVGTFIAPSALKIQDVWQFVAPKLYLRPHKAREAVCPSYAIDVGEFLMEEVTTLNTFEKKSVVDFLQSQESSFCQDIDLEALETREKLVARRSESVENISTVLTSIITQNVHAKPPRTRSSSVPNKHWLEEDSLIIHLEYHQVLQEINIQKENIKMYHKSSKELESLQEVVHQNNVEPSISDENKEAVQHDLHTGDHNELDEPFPQKDLKELISPAQMALMAGRNYIYYPPRKTRKSNKKSSKNIARISAIEKFLERPTNVLQRTQSFSILTNGLNYGKEKIKKKKPSTAGSHKRSNSLTNVKSFDNWAKMYKYSGEKPTRDWITVVWDSWFDEIYPPLLDNVVGIPSDKVVDKLEYPREITADVKEDTDLREILELPEKIDAVLEEVDEEFRDSVIETLHEEISSLTNEMMKSSKPNAFLLSRRGTIYKKLGFLRASLQDLNEAILLEPGLLTAYWERHLLHLLCNKLQTAIEDLNFILKHDKKNISAYKSRAGIYESLGDTSLAISNLSQAIRHSPNDADAYLNRAELYEKNGDQRLALEDYNQIIQHQPNNSLAMMKHGLYYINVEQWQLAVKDFSDILRHEPLNAEARLYRGIALAKLHQWQDALLDYSVVIHVNPNNSKAYFRRGCLLLQSEPSLAIRDFSISLLLDSSDENLLSYLYRAILYAQTKQFSEAIVDFEMVIYFSKDMCCAHIDLGLVYFESEDYEKAIKYFTLGLAADPTYIRAFVCRAEAYFKMDMYDEAIKDINRAIHVYPDRSNYYMLRGDFYLAKGKMKLAEMCVRQAAVISHSLGQSLVQQALVHSFLHNYDQAIDALYQSTRNKPTPALLNLLGMTQMKAKRWKDAITSFSICLEQMKPKSDFKPWPPAAANLYFMVAQCYLELNNYKQSQQAFKATVKINPKHAEAYYQQGWCRLRLGQLKKGILDLNQALAINPRLYQAYLARATLFGHKKQYTKAILNCNEVISIEPQCLRAYLYRGVLKYKIKAYSLAVKDLTEAINMDPNCILAYFNRALCFNAEKRNFKKAIQDYSVVLILKDELSLHQKSYLNRGIVYLDLGDVENALYDFNKAFSMQTNDVKILMAVGICHHRLKNLEEATRTFTHCLDLNPKFHWAKVCRGNVSMDFNTVQSYELAMKDYESVIYADPKNLDAYVNLGFCLQAQGKFKRAWEIFTMAIENHPKSIKPLDGRAIVCLQMGDLQGSLKDLNSAIAINAQSSILYTNRAVVHQLMGDGIRSMKDYNKAILIGGGDCSVAYYNIGCVYLHNYQITQASDSFMNALTIDPTDEAIWMNLALVNVLNDKPREALEYIDKAISLAPYVAYFYFNRANVYCQLQEYSRAEMDFSTCLNISPDDAKVHKARADSRSKLGDSAGAIQDYKTSVYISNCLRK